MVTPDYFGLPDWHKLYTIPSLGISILFCAFVAFLVSTADYKKCIPGWLAYCFYLHINRFQLGSIPTSRICPPALAYCINRHVIVCSNRAPVCANGRRIVVCCTQETTMYGTPFTLVNGTNHYPL